MTKKTEPGDGSFVNSANQNSEKTSDINIPIVGSGEVAEQKAENRETGKHDPFFAPIKNIRHYLFEFLMLFLAVFSGFLAENKREQLQEHQREKDFIHSLIEDLKSDTLQSDEVLSRLNSINKGIDSVLTALSYPETMENSDNVYRLWTNNMGLQAFVSNDRTIEQLKNSGELRLIRNKAVSDRIMEYDQILKKYYVQSNLMYSALGSQRIYSQIFDFIDLNKNKGIPVPMTEQGRKILNEAYGNLQLWNRGLLGLISWLEVVNNEGKNLVVFIQKEYHLN